MNENVNHMTTICQYYMIIYAVSGSNALFENIPYNRNSLKIKLINNNNSNNNNKNLSPLDVSVRKLFRNTAWMILIKDKEFTKSFTGNTYFF